MIPANIHADAQVDAISADTRFGCAYEAAGIVAAHDVEDLLGRVLEFKMRVGAHIEIRLPGAWK